MARGHLHGISHPPKIVIIRQQKSSHFLLIIATYCHWWSRSGPIVLLLSTVHERGIGHDSSAWSTTAPHHPGDILARFKARSTPARPELDAYKLATVLLLETYFSNRSTRHTNSTRREAKRSEILFPCVSWPLPEHTPTPVSIIFL